MFAESPDISALFYQRIMYDAGRRPVPSGGQPRGRMERTMFNACGFRTAFTAMAVGCAAYAGIIQPAAGQQLGWNVATYGMVPSVVPRVYSVPQAMHPYGPPARTAPRGPLARLVRNPDPSGALPPFALADQAGTIQRYVEPVPGIDLDSCVDQVVVVRHDTGRTLLASQLELPPPRLYPMLGDADSGGQPDMSGRRSALASGVPKQGRIIRPARFVDNDDSTVQLLPDGEEMPDGNKTGTPPQVVKDSAPVETIEPAVEYPTFPDEISPGMEGMGPMSREPGYYDPRAMESCPAETYGTEVCPECGGYHLPPGRGPVFGAEFGPACGSQQPEHCRYYGDVEINFLRLHLMEDAIGKLSEKYEFSPRFILGYEGTGVLDGRARYWYYGRDTRVLGGGAVRVEFNVLDLEATQRFAGRRSEVLLAAGVRVARVDLTDEDDDEEGADLVGLTFAADGRTALGGFQEGRLAWVYGGRLSILGGDWGGDSGNDFVGGRVRDDNVVADELYAGVEYAVCCRDFDLHARLGVEMQNWHSDVLSQNGGADSIGFIGPGVQVGAEF